MSLLIRSLLLFAAFSGVIAQAETPLTFKVSFDKQIFSEPYTGRVYIFFAKENPQPRKGPSWFRPEPFVAQDVNNWRPGSTIEFKMSDTNLLKLPADFSEIDLTGMNAQAVVRFNPFERKVGTGPGNGYSETITIGDQSTYELVVDTLVEAKEATETDRTKIVSVESKLLSEFHDRPVELNAAVTLPENYNANQDKKYPVIYEIPGFGGTHLNGWQGHQKPASNSHGVEFIKVMLDPSCPRGHHVFANSANNGPFGDALIQELIPAIDKQFRTDARPYGRFLTGHSSGGWSSLWLQVAYPEFFGGVWSTAPDPVDFRDFQRINLYNAGENMFVDGEGKRRPLGRVNGKVIIWYDSFSDMENVLGYGGQLHSFEAVFSPRGTDGKPLSLWNRETGEIDTDVANTWKKYDINLILKENWQELEPKLRGKLHVFMGDVDTFYLEGATMLLKETMAQLNSDAEITILPGKDHMNLFEGGLHEKIEEEIAEQYVKHKS